MSAKHTPGPWRIEGYTRLLGGGVTGHTISHGVNNYRDGPEGYVCTTNGTSEADARLIAAAPDLFDALQDIVADDDAGVSLADQRSRWDERMSAARAALAKATGAPQ